MAGRAAGGSLLNCEPRTRLSVTGSPVRRKADDFGVPKVIPDATFIGEEGVVVVQRILFRMRYAWQSTGRFDAGIDGYIELRDRQTREMLGAHLGAQVKTRAKFTGETEGTFEFLCDQEDVDYWLRSNLPVVLICVRSGTDDAWFKSVTDYFADPDVRAERRVLFDKSEDRFDEQAASALRDLALPPDAGVPRQGLTGPETLLTNLLPIASFGDHIWSASTDCSDREQVHARYSEADEAAGKELPRASDYILRDGRLYSLRDPKSCELARICNRATATGQPVADWAASNDVEVQRRFADLLRRTLLQQLKSRVNWQHDKRLFYFAVGLVDPPDVVDDDASPELADVVVAGEKAKRTVVSVKRVPATDGGERISYVKHLAFRPRFLRFDGAWYLEITPDWYYSYDGIHEAGQAGTLRAGLKKLERNAAVVGHVKFWEHMLTTQLSAFDPDNLPLRFRPLRAERVPVGIHDRTWQGSRARRSAAAKASARRPAAKRPTPRKQGRK